MLSRFKTKYCAGRWWKQEVHSYLPAVLDYQLFRVGDLSYTSAQVQGPAHGRHLTNVFLIGGMN